MVRMTQEIADEVCSRLAGGESLRRICADEHIPHRKTVIEWKNSSEAAARQYERARQDQAELWADEIMDIADDGSNDFRIGKVNEYGERIVDVDHISRSRLRVDSRKWMLSKLKPGTYGDKVQVAGDGALSAIPVRVVVELVGGETVAPRIEPVTREGDARKPSVQLIG